MTCPRTHLIVRLASGELPPGEERALREHLETCQICAAAQSEMGQTWDALGAWQVDVSSVDLTGRVLDEAGAEDYRPDRRVRPTAYWRVPLRAAASIVLAVGCGAAAGRLMPVGKPTAVPEGIAEALELIGFPSESATGLPFSVEFDEAPIGDEMP